jgi:hypothetical protein
VRVRPRGPRLAGVRSSRSRSAARRRRAHRLVGDRRARGAGWAPGLDFEQLAHLLVDADVERLQAPATSMERR